MTDRKPVLNLDDPLLPHFVYQHDLRARLWHSLEEIVSVLNSGEDPEDIVAAVKSIATDAIDVRSVRAWVLAGRPLPYIEPSDSELAVALNEALEELIGPPPSP
jgi:hypothetical protein